MSFGMICPDTEVAGIKFWDVRNCTYRQTYNTQCYNTNDNTFISLTDCLDTLWFALSENHFFYWAQYLLPSFTKVFHLMSLSTVISYFLNCLAFLRIVMNIKPLYQIRFKHLWLPMTWNMFFYCTNLSYTKTKTDFCGIIGYLLWLKCMRSFFYCHLMFRKICWWLGENHSSFVFKTTRGSNQFGHCPNSGRSFSLHQALGRSSL